MLLFDMVNDMFQVLACLCQKLY